MADQTVINLDALLDGKVHAEYVPDAFGPGQGVFIRPFTAAEHEAWRSYAAMKAKGNLAKQGSIIETLQMKHCLLADADGTSLFGEKKTDERVAEFKAGIGAGHWQFVVKKIDSLSGFGDDFVARLAAAGVPIPGESSDSGASTDSADSPENAEAA